MVKRKFSFLFQNLEWGDAPPFLFRRRCAGVFIRLSFVVAIVSIYTSMNIINYTHTFRN